MSPMAYAEIGSFEELEDHYDPANYSRLLY